MSDPQAKPCKSCGALVYWAITSTGSRMPVDACPVPDGNCTLAIRRTSGELHVEVHARSTDIAVERNRYTSHFATCPDAEDHRK